MLPVYPVGAVRSIPGRRGATRLTIELPMLTPLLKFLLELIESPALLIGEDLAYPLEVISNDRFYLGAASPADLGQLAVRFPDNHSDFALLGRRQVKVAREMLQKSFGPRLVSPLNEVGGAVFHVSLCPEHPRKDSQDEYEEHADRGFQLVIHIPFSL